MAHTHKSYFDKLRLIYPADILEMCNHSSPLQLESLLRLFFRMEKIKSTDTEVVLFWSRKLFKLSFALFMFTRCSRGPKSPCFIFIQNRMYLTEESNSVIVPQTQVAVLKLLLSFFLASLFFISCTPWEITNNVYNFIMNFYKSVRL